MLSWRFRSDSISPLMPSPGIPKITSMPQSIRVWTRTSPAVRAMLASFLFFFDQPPGCGRPHRLSGPYRTQFRLDEHKTRNCFLFCAFGTKEPEKHHAEEKEKAEFDRAAKHCAKCVNHSWRNRLVAPRWRHYSGCFPGRERGKHRNGRRLKRR